MTSTAAFDAGTPPLDPLIAKRARVAVATLLGRVQKPLPFLVRKLSTPPRSQVLQQLEDLSSLESIDRTRPLLFYYFGHGFIRGRGELLLAYRGTPTASNASLDSLLDECVGHGFEQVVAVIDCCHGGVSARKIQLRLGHQNHYLMCGADTRYAFFAENGGVFTSALCTAVDGARPPRELIDPVANGITYKRWFDFAGRAVNSAFEAGGLGAEVFQEVGYESIVEPRVRHAQVRSAYTKLYRVLRHLDVGARATAEDILSRIRSERDRAFVLAINMSGSRRRFEYVGPACVRGYLEWLGELGFARRSARAWSVTPDGRSALRKDGVTYNKALVDRMLSYLDGFGVSDDLIRACLGELIREVAVPDIASLRQRLALKGAHRAQSVDLGFAMKVLSYAGFYRRTSADTYFP